MGQTDGTHGIEGKTKSGMKVDDLGISDAPNLRFLQGLVGLGAVGTFLFFALGG